MRIFTEGGSLGRKVFLAFVALICPVCLMMALLPFVMNARTGGPRLTCISNLKQLVFANLAYSEDWDDRLPPRDTWMDSTYDYFKNENLLHCNEVEAQFPNRKDVYGFSFNSLLSGAKAWPIETEIAEKRPLLYDSSNLARNASDPFNSLPDPPRHRGTVNIICFLDGHAQALIKAKAKELRP